jgi:hypothetical protein
VKIRSDKSITFSKKVKVKIKIGEEKRTAPRWKWLNGDGRKMKDKGTNHIWKKHRR